MKYVPDRLHGFSERPHYDGVELDILFERIVTSFLKRKYGSVTFPLSTEDLTVLIEKDVSDLEQYADLTRFGDGVEGVTVFGRNEKPRVYVASELTEDDRRINRLRTTLAHEYGHVKLHAYMFDLGGPARTRVPSGEKPNAIYCKQETMLQARASDWREWQAGYACGAVLMPASFVRRTAKAVQARYGCQLVVSPDSALGESLIAAVCEEYQVSRDAARVRLSVLKILSKTYAQGTLFNR